MLRRALPLLAVWVFPVLLGLPFVGRAFFVDDHYQLLMARGLLEHPLRPYDFLADDSAPDQLGWERGRPPRMVNPPGHHYLLALFWHVSGERLWLVRLMSLFLAGGTAVFFFLLARRVNVPPGPVTALAAVTPAFWLTSYSLLIDSTLLFFFLGALWTWVEGLRRRSTGWLVVSGVMMGLTLFTKYTGALLGPVALMFWYWDKPSGRRARPLGALVIPLVMFGGWCVWNMATYGAVHLVESSKRAVQDFSPLNVFMFATFLGGVFLFPLDAWRSAGGRTRWAGVAGAGLLALWLIRGGFTGWQSAGLALLAGGSALFVLNAARHLKDTRYPLDRWLLAWLALGAVQTVYVMQWTAARYYLTILFPAACLAWRLWDREVPLRPHRLATRWKTAVAVLCVVGAWLALGDYRQAETRRLIARDLTRDGWLSGGHRGYTLADSFTDGYVRPAGWRAAFPSTVFEPGDYILAPTVSMPAWWFRAGAHPVRTVAVYEYASAYLPRVMDNRGSAGFYASAWGALPFTFGRGPLERFVLYQVTAGGAGD